MVKMFSMPTSIMLLLLVACNSKSHETSLEKQLMAKSDSLKVLLSRVDTLKQLNKEGEETEGYLFDSFDIDELKRKGIKDPEHDIINDLLSKPHLIPYPGELGGTMKFEYAVLLNNRWAFANFTDGHVMGELLFQYKVKKDSTLQWILIDKYIE